MVKSVGSCEDRTDDLRICINKGKRYHLQNGGALVK